MKPLRRARHALMFFGAGSLAAYFLDPDSGQVRRERFLQQVRSLTNPEPSGEPERGESDGDESAPAAGEPATGQPFDLPSEQQFSPG